MSTSVFDQAWQRERPARAFEDLLYHLTVVRDALAAAPTDLPPPAPRRTPPSSAVPKPSHGAGSLLRRLHDARPT
jgi:hypothetical protein